MPGLAPPPSLPRWKGEPLAGRSLLLVAEQGLGDTIHFVRYARLLKDRGARVVLAVRRRSAGCWRAHPDLDELFLLGSDRGVAAGRFLSAAAECPVRVWAPTPDDSRRSSLPLGRSRADRPSGGAELAEIEGFKIGIAWQGSRDYRRGSLAFDSAGPVCAAGPLARRAADQPAKGLRIGADRSGRFSGP